MKITKITVYQVTLPLEHPYRLSGGRLYFDKLDSTIIAMDTDEGIRGWGEGCPWGSTYLPAFPRGIRAGIEELAPQLMGLDPRRIDLIYRTMDTALPGHPYIKSALDMACWDILGKSTGLPLCELFGGRIDQEITIQNSVPTGTPEEMIESIKRGQAKGETVHTCKIGADVALDIERIKAIGAYLPPSETATFDVNRAWLVDEAMRVMNSVKEPILYFEQPCETYEECLQVRKLTNHPIILDECIQAYGHIVRAHADSACEAIGLKIGRVGGLTKAKRIRDFCVETGIRMNIEVTGGSVIGDAGSVHLAQSTPATHLRATWLCHEMLTVDTATGGPRNKNGKTSAPEIPGLGIEPIMDVLGEAIATYS
ncbi:mandelate racemase/muconate lactonizing enzyme family protein [Roseofilum casamattae]|uniref:Mandelate racemase/muconate lactonizing enzyme family protein n=1 Tax=Roseofilum casamattae BLCC-M143 TaxID=3022442 RepID=A0ABT7BW29_9CYAN|nr:mandelate racemase/muconate lactonizing enzyme family protein [Roseofilum casamattae]MDJ1183390.1 mandelate racemase/muconate lactonizing enzyme family protein [Roseofilum casamattae BLCC-M143]